MAVMDQMGRKACFHAISLKNENKTWMERTGEQRRGKNKIKKKGTKGK